MGIEEQILKIAKTHKTFSTNDILKGLEVKYTRAYILRFIKVLVQEGILFKSGVTRATVYSLDASAFLGDYFEKRYTNKDLDEYKIWEEVLEKTEFLKKTNENIRSILVYAFTEMLNNAIDHSKSRSIRVKFEKTRETIRFEIDDFGIGVFLNVMKKRNLKSELEAIQDLLKGKTTTAPHAHSGEGIFFTSKTADTFMLDSYDYQLRVDDIVKDTFISNIKPRKRGTKVTFEINENHKGHLNDIFKKYYTDEEEKAFDKTEIHIQLYTMGSIYISRSQAKRVLSGLEKFKTVILDFHKVPGVGQAFVDEVFRVFQKKNPNINIIPINMCEAVSFMVERGTG